MEAAKRKVTGKKVSDLQYGPHAQLEAQLKKEEKGSLKQENPSFLRTQVGAEEDSGSRLARRPASGVQMMQGERDKLLTMEDNAAPARCRPGRGGARRRRRPSGASRAGPV